MFTELFITVYSVVVQVGGQAELCLGCEDAQRPAIEQGDELQGWAILTFKAGIMEKQGEETWAVQISKKKTLERILGSISGSFKDREVIHAIGFTRCSAACVEYVHFIE